VIALHESATRLEGAPSSFDEAVPSIARVDLRTLKAREQVAIQKIREKDAMRGKGVGKEAQDLFDMLAKTYVYQCKLFCRGQHLPANDFSSRIET